MIYLANICNVFRTMSETQGGAHIVFGKINKSIQPLCKLKGAGLKCKGEPPRATGGVLTRL